MNGYIAFLAALLYCAPAPAGTANAQQDRPTEASAGQGTTLALRETRLSRHHKHDVMPDAAQRVVEHVDAAMRTPTNRDGTDFFFGVNAGYVGILNRFENTLRYGAEFRWQELGPWHLRPAGGLAIAENDAHFVYLGLRRDFPQSERWLITTSFDAGYFEESRELNLGFDLEFRSGLELAYRFFGGFRAGIALYHLSNGGFGDRNPGTESLVLSFHSALD